MTPTSQTINFGQGITPDLFAEDCSPKPAQENLNNGLTLLRGLITHHEMAILESIRSILSQAPLRDVYTPSGLKMSVTMSNCGQVGWISDRHGYRYSPLDPETGNPWPLKCRNYSGRSPRWRLLKQVFPILLQTPA